MKTLTGDVELPTETAADILIVVDNSGSMQEEQDQLRDNFINLDAAQCPLQDLRNIPNDFKNPAPELYAPGGPLALCGFIQLVAAYENDFRVGVITTDVGLCDNRLPVPGDTRGFKPQRGCLQPDAAGRKVIARSDLDEGGDVSDDNLAGRFAETLANISTFGTPFERGLDAMSIFLDAGSERHPECTGDLDAFRRPDASLVVIFLTDEEDCSHGTPDALAAFGDEFRGETCGAFEEHFIRSPFAADCYEKFDQLSPIDAYDDIVLAQDPRAKIAVIAGGLPDAAGDVVPSGCIVGGDGAPAGGADVCFESGGNSNVVTPGTVCAPDTADERDNLPCCVADPGSRYFAFADLVGNKATDSICNSSFRQTMLDIAAFIAAVDQVQLAEPPTEGGVLVEVTRAGSDEVLILEQLPGTADCSVETGFRLDGDRVILCGEGRAGPGDSVVIRGRGEEEPTCGQPRFEVSGGGANCSSTNAPSFAALMTIMAGAFAALLGRRRRAR